MRTKDERPKKSAPKLSKKTIDLLNKHRISNLETYDRIIFRIVTHYDNHFNSNEKLFSHPTYIK